MKLFSWRLGVKIKLKTFLFYSLTTFLILYMLSNPYCITYYCKKALQMCYQTVVPSLFVFTVFSHILAQSAVPNTAGKKTHKYNEFLFGISKNTFFLCVFGFFSGAIPAGVGILSLYSEGRISKNEAENALLLLPGCSAPFILTICRSVLDSPFHALLLLLSNTLAIITSFFILCKKTQNKPINSTIPHLKMNSYFKIITQSLEKSAINTLIICSYVIFFNVISGITIDIVQKFGLKNNTLHTLMFGIFEMTSGIVRASMFDGNEKIVFIAFMCSFSGISIIFQLSGICNEKGISVKSFILSRILCGVLCPLYMLLLMFILPYKMTYFTEHTTVFNINKIDCAMMFYSSLAFSVIALLLIIVCRIDKKHKKNVQK